MVRAVATASAISRSCSLPVVAWPEVHERMGVFMEDERTGELIGRPGKSRSYFEEHYPQLLLPDSLNEHGWWSRPAETEPRWKQRAGDFLAELRRRHPVPGDVCAVETPADWSADLASWALTLAPGDLPPAPIDFRPGHTILDAARFLGRLQADVRSGPAGPRARFGALQGDLAQLHRLLSSHQRSTHQEHRPAGTACDTGEKHPPRPAGDKGRPAGAMG